MKKKGIMAISAIIAAMVFISGCSAGQNTDLEANATEVSAEDYVQKAQAILEETTGFAADFTAQIQMGGEETEILIEAAVKMTTEPLASGIEIRNTYGETTSDSKIYLEEIADGVNLYMAYGDQWTEMTMAEENALQTVGIYDARENMGLLLAAGTEWTETAHADGIVTLTGQIPAEKVYQVSEGAEFLQLAGMNGVGENYYVNVAAVPVEVQLKPDGTPISYSIDLADTLETVINCVLLELDSEGENRLSVEKYMIAEKFTDITGVHSVEIPAAARDAINYEREIVLMESEAGK